ncbi:MAG: hypothetical protein IJN97_03770, partial [Oscillospiraceae bacterium]|nr:hypothetical protein [Oscillospiraceae bacterium]
LRARGGYELDVKWENYEVRDIYITADFDGDVTLELPETQKAHNFRDDKENIYTVKENKLTLSMHKNERLNLIAE